MVSESRKKWLKKYREENRLKLLGYAKKYKSRDPERYRQYSRKRMGAIGNRFSQLKYKYLRKEQVPKSDLLWHLNFYAELIKDGVCHYCLGPISSTSMGLDAVDNGIGHRCFNVVPCCGDCNSKKSNTTTYEEMMLLSPVLRHIRRQRESRRIEMAQSCEEALGGSSKKKAAMANSQPGTTSHHEETLEQGSKKRAPMAHSGAASTSHKDEALGGMKKKKPGMVGMGGNVSPGDASGDI